MTGRYASQKLRQAQWFNAKLRKLGIVVLDSEYRLFRQTFHGARTSVFDHRLVSA